MSSSEKLQNSSFASGPGNNSSNAVQSNSGSSDAGDMGSNSSDAFPSNLKCLVPLHFFSCRFKLAFRRVS